MDAPHGTKSACPLAIAGILDHFSVQACIIQAFCVVFSALLLCATLSAKLRKLIVVCVIACERTTPTTNSWLLVLADSSKWFVGATSWLLQVVWLLRGRSGHGAVPSFLRGAGRRALRFR
eukprot:scaffold547_cov384-Prasinococcus_capsulatus_cf.AAC.25